VSLGVLLFFLIYGETELRLSVCRCGDKSGRFHAGSLTQDPGQADRVYEFGK
jgi:hypothetical protein